MIDHSILITGGTGYFGQAFVRDLLADDVGKVVVYSHVDEHQRQMRAALPDARLHFWLGDIRDGRALRRAILHHNVDQIVHTAAIKSVPSCELFPLEAIQTNVEGTANVVDVAEDLAIQRVVSLSSDKALLPTSVYGATKALVERLMVASGFAAVRPGNFIGSTGSVLPIWRKQVASGEPITVTDPKMTRFYMPLAEAVAFVRRVLVFMRGGEIFVPKLLACRLADLADHVSVNQQRIGPRPGERLHECLLLPDEPVADKGWAYVVTAGAPAFGRSYRSDEVSCLDPATVVEAS